MAGREAEVADAEALTDSERARLERLERTAEEREAELDARERAIAENEEDVFARAGRGDAEREAIERERTALAELRERLERKEREVGAYVAQVQGSLARPAEWPRPGDDDSRPRPAPGGAWSTPWSPASTDEPSTDAAELVDEPPHTWGWARSGGDELL